MAENLQNPDRKLFERTALVLIVLACAAPIWHQERLNPLPDWKLNAIQRIKAWQIPLWDSHVQNGIPTIGVGRTAIFFPTIYFNLIMPEEPARLWAALAKLAACMLGTWAVGRRAGLSPPGRMLAAIAFAWLGILHIGPDNSAANVAAVLPWLVLALLRVFEKPTPGRMAVVSLSAAFACLGGNPTAILYSAVLVVFVLIVGCFKSIPGVCAAIAALIIGIIMAAAQLIPLYEFLNLSGSILLTERLAVALLLPASIAAIFLVDFINKNSIKAAAAIVAICVVAVLWPSMWIAPASESLPEMPQFNIWPTSDAPRVWVAPEAQYFPSRLAVLVRMNSTVKFDPRKTVFIDPEADNPYDESLGTLDDRQNPNWYKQTANRGNVPTAIVQEISPEQINVILRGNGQGWLVLFDRLYPGWQAQLFLEPRNESIPPRPLARHTPIIPAFGVVRSVFVTPRVGRVVFTYDPPTWRWGVLISATGVLACLLLVGLALGRENTR